MRNPELGIQDFEKAMSAIFVDMGYMRRWFVFSFLTVITEVQQARVLAISDGDSIRLVYKSSRERFIQSDSPCSCRICVFFVIIHCDVGCITHRCNGTFIPNDFSVNGFIRAPLS